MPVALTLRELKWVKAFIKTMDNAEKEVNKRDKISRSISMSGVARTVIKEVNK